MLKKIGLYLLPLILIPLAAYAAGKAFPSSTNQTLLPVAGVNSSDEMVGLNVDADGNLQVDVLSGTLSASVYAPSNGVITINLSGATDRIQGDDVDASACTFQSDAANASDVYIGGPTVTNASGANVGIKLEAGDTLSNLSVSNLNTVYFAADVSAPAQLVYWICN